MGSTVDSEVLNALKVLQRHNFKEAEALLKKEAGLIDTGVAEEFLEFKAEASNDPKSFELAYEEVLNFIESAPEQHRVELSGLLYPIFVQLYMRLVSGNYSSEALELLNKYSRYQEDFYHEDIQALAQVTGQNDIFTNPVVETFKASEFAVSIASSSYSILNRFLREKNLCIVQSILKDQLHVEVIDGPPRTKIQLLSRRGAIFGESRRDANSEPVLYGPLRDSNLDMENSEVAGLLSNNQEAEVDVTPSKKKKKKDTNALGHKSSKYDDGKGSSVSPALDRIPLPVLSDAYWEQRRTIRREMLQITRSIQQKNSSPHISSLLYTVCNAQPGESAMAIRRGGVPCMAFSDDLGMLAAAQGSGRVRVWSLGAQSLRQMLPPEQLEALDMNDSRIRSKVLHDGNGGAQLSRDLIGHQGTCYGVGFSPDGSLVASGGSDGTVRLWSTTVWGGALTVWRDHVFPVWCVDWAGVYGHYVASGGEDRTARLYAVDHAPMALRLCTGHWSAVTTVALHPNVNYLASGSADRAVRLFDMRAAGRAVRLFTGHKGSVQSLAYSPCGRYLASGCWSGAICLWDLATGAQVGQLGGYSATKSASVATRSADELLTGPVVSLAFSPDGSQLAAGGMEGALRVWNVGTRLSSILGSGENTSHTTTLLGTHNTLSSQQQSEDKLTGTYYGSASGYDVTHSCLQDAFFTRRTPVLAVRFFHPYLILAAGPYKQC